MEKTKRIWIGLFISVLGATNSDAWTSKIGVVGGTAYLKSPELFRQPVEAEGNLGVGLDCGGNLGIQYSLRKTHVGLSCILRYHEFSDKGEYIVLRWMDAPNEPYHRKTDFRILSLSLGIDFFLVKAGRFQPFVGFAISFNSFFLSRIEDEIEDLYTVQIMDIMIKPFSEKIRVGTSLDAGFKISLSKRLEIVPSIRYETFNELFNIDHDTRPENPYEDIYEYTLSQKELVAISFSVALVVLL